MSERHAATARLKPLDDTDEHLLSSRCSSCTALLALHSYGPRTLPIGPGFAQPPGKLERTTLAPGLVVRRDRDLSAGLARYGLPRGRSSARGRRRDRVATEELRSYREMRGHERLRTHIPDDVEVDSGTRVVRGERVNEPVLVYCPGCNVRTVVDPPGSYPEQN